MNSDDTACVKVCHFIYLIAWALTEKTSCIAPPIISHPPQQALPLFFHLIMWTAEIQCPGCDKLFRPRGLSQHINRSQDACCHGVGAPLASQVPVVSIPYMVLAQPHDPFLPSQVSDDGCPDDNSDSQYIIGEFTATCAAHGS